MDEAHPFQEYPSNHWTWECRGNHQYHFKKERRHGDEGETGSGSSMAIEMSFLRQEHQSLTPSVNFSP
ncbi:hypothetical protein SSU98_0973 [Streptococcus suis 98HAH33]|nr:hypothetical protein SSU98_0973 [Streptococcus suis 98HAH33]